MFYLDQESIDVHKEDSKLFWSPKTVSVHILGWGTDFNQFVHTLALASDQFQTQAKPSYRAQRIIIIICAVVELRSSNQYPTARGAVQIQDKRQSLPQGAYNPSSYSDLKMGFSIVPKYFCFSPIIYALFRNRLHMEQIVIINKHYQSFIPPPL